MVSGPAGMRCPECSSLRGTHLYKVQPLQLAVLTLIGAIAGAVGVTIVNSTGWLFFVIFLSTAYGAGVGELMLRAISRKRGPVVEWTGSVAFAVGGLLPLVYMIVATQSFLILRVEWLSLVALGIATTACFSRLKY
jgi:hypothetical protein